MIIIKYSKIDFHFCLRINDTFPKIAQFPFDSLTILTVNKLLLYLLIKVHCFFSFTINNNVNTKN